MTFRDSFQYFSQDPFPLGEIHLGPSVRGYWVDEEVPAKLQHYTNIFMLHTPARSKGGFPLLAEDSASKMAWISALQASLRDYKRLSPSRDLPCSSAQRREQRLGYEEEDNITSSTSSKVTTIL